MNYYLTVLKKYVVFSGRAQRAEYWYFILFNIIVSIVLGVLDSVLFDAGGMTYKDGIIAISTGTLGTIYSLAVFLPSLAVSVRRLHDTNRSAWNLLWAFLPIIGWIVLIIFTATDSIPGENKYGKNPKGE